MPHPILFLVLIIPFGLTLGFLTVALAYQLTQQGVATGAIAGVIALSYLPHTWKFLWAPLVDTLLTRKLWYAIGALGCGTGLFLSGAFTSGAHTALGMLSGVLMIGSFASTLVSMAVESLMAASVADEARGRASGWFQAGNLGGMGLGGGLGLWLMQNAGWSAAGAGALLAAVCAACCIALYWVGDARPAAPPDDASRPGAPRALLSNVRAIVDELWQLVRSRPGALAVAICFLPIGSGAAQNLWSAVASDWHTPPATIALVNGALGGLVSALGCLVGGWWCDRMDRRSAYCLFGTAQLLAAIGMALSARTPAQFVAWTLLYAFVQGLSYAAYSAVVLEAIGRTAGATKFSLLAALANMPIAYMTLADGRANDRWGSTGMLLVEAGCGAIGLAVFGVLAGATRRRRAVASAVQAGAAA